MVDFGKREINFLGLRLVLLVAATVIFLGLRLALQGLLPTRELSASDLSPENILSGVSREREIRNLAALNSSAKLKLAADGKARDMRDRNYFSHIDPDGNYIWPRVETAGYAPYAALGENLAIDFFSTDSLIQAWINSPTHRANLLNEIFQDQGVGLALGNAEAGQHATSIVNVFGKLALKPPTSAPKALPPAATASPPKAKPAPKPLPAPVPSAPEPSQPAAPALPGAAPPKAQTPASPGVNFFKQIFTRGPVAGQVPAPSRDRTFAQQPEQKTAPATEAPKSTRGNPANPYQAYRTWILAGSAAILIILIMEIWTVLKRKLFLPHRTLNNLIMIIIILLVAALVYWF